MTPRIIKLVLATLLFYAIGRLGYEHFYRWTIDIIESFSTVPLNFFGKFPFLFFGDPIFALILASIPLSVFLISKVSGNSLSKTTLLYTLYFVSTYLVNCWGISIWLLASNDFYKPGQHLSYNVRQIDLNQLYLSSVVVSTILTAATLAVLKLISRYKSRRPSFRA